MAVINLRNVVALGVLEDGVYPSVYNGQTGEYIGTVDGEGAGVKTVPTLYMYYRKNGHLYLYRTKERIEIDLTNVTAYDNSALFKLTEKSDISSAKITEFESRNIDVGHYEYKVPWVKSTQQYLYIQNRLHQLCLQVPAASMSFPVHICQGSLKLRRYSGLVFHIWNADWLC